MDRFSFLDAQPWLEPADASQCLSAPVFTGQCVLSFSSSENSGAAAPQLPQGPCAPDAKHLFFLTSDASPDAACSRVEVHRSSDGVVLVFDGRAYRLRGSAVLSVIRRPAAAGVARPPFVSVLFRRVTLTLVPSNASGGSPECGLTAAAQAFELCSTSPESVAAVDGDPGDAVEDLLRWRSSVNALCAAAAAGATDRRLADATARVASATVQLRRHVDAPQVFCPIVGLDSNLDQTLVRARDAARQKFAAALAQDILQV